MTDDSENMKNYERNIRLIEKLIPDCGSQIGSLAVGAQRNVRKAFENKEINRGTLAHSENKIDELVNDFAYNCRCTLLPTVLPSALKK